MLITITNQPLFIASLTPQHRILSHSDPQIYGQYQCRPKPFLRINDL
jgi:hypothetical protein